VLRRAEEGKCVAGPATGCGIPADGNARFAHLGGRRDCGQDRHMTTAEPS
jgi:hypothetical protein